MAARQAVIRWAWRLFGREWRQQLLVLALLTVAVAATVFSVSAAYNLVRSAAPGSARPPIAWSSNGLTGEAWPPRPGRSGRGSAPSM